MNKTVVNNPAFVACSGLYKYSRTPSGLRNAPERFQRAMDVKLTIVNWQYALVYTDYTIIFSKTSDKHLQHIEKMLKLLSNTRTTIKLKKCSFISDTIDYLGHIIAGGKVHDATKTTKAIKSLQYPNAVSELRFFLRFCSFNRRSVHEFARLALLLNTKQKNEEPLQYDLDEEEKNSVDFLQEKLTTPSVLALPRSDNQYIIDTDACSTQVGCVLLQQQKNNVLTRIGSWS